MQTPAPQSIWFDPQRRAATPELQAVVKSLIASIEQHEADLAPRLRARREIDRRSFHLAIECIVCNLAALIVTGLDWPLAVPRSSGVMWARGVIAFPFTVGITSPRSMLWRSLRSALSTP